MDGAAARFRRRLLLALGASAIPACVGHGAADGPVTVVDVGAGAPRASAATHRDQVATAIPRPLCSRDEMVERFCRPLEAEPDGIGEPCPSEVTEAAGSIAQKPARARFDAEMTAARSVEGGKICCYERCALVEMAKVPELTCPPGRRATLCAFPPSGGPGQGADAPYAECPAGIVGAAPERPATHGPRPFSAEKTAQRREREPGICCYEECGRMTIQVHEGRPLIVRGAALVAGLASDDAWMQRGDA